MLTGKALFNTLTAELKDIGLKGMAASLEELYRSPQFLELDPLSAIARVVEPEYQAKIPCLKRDGKITVGLGSRKKLSQIWENFLEK